MTDLPTHNYNHNAEVLARTFVTAVLLTAILLAGAYLRLIGLDWDDNHHLHPDERFLTQVESAMIPVTSLAQYFDTNTSTLNPNNVGYGFFVYGDFPIILVRYVGDLLQMTTYFDVYIIGRITSAISDLLTILLLFFLANHLFDRRIGLLSAALYAALAFPIQQSHFFTVDTITTVFVVAAFLFAARALTGHNWLDYPLFGLTLGLAMSSKVSVYPLALIMVIALGLRLAREIGGAGTTQTLGEGQPVSSLEQRDRVVKFVSRAAVALVATGLVTVITFRVGQPYAFLPPNSGGSTDTEPSGLMTLIGRAADPVGFQPNPLWLTQMQEVRRQVSGNADIPPNHQWGKRLPLVFPWLNMVRVGMGWPVGVFSWLAFAWALWEIGRGHRGAAQLMLPVTWVALFFTWQGIGWVKTMRYFLPLYPFMAMLAAWALVTLWDRIQTLITERHASRWHWSAIVSAGLIVLIVASGWAWGFAVSRIYTRPVTRVEASNWIFEHIPSDVTLSFSTPDGPRQFQLGLINNWPPPDEGAINETTRPSVEYTYLIEGLAQPFSFQLPFSGTLTDLRLNHVMAPEERVESTTLHITLAADLAGTDILAEVTITDEFKAINDPRGEPVDVALGGVDLQADTKYYLLLEADQALVFSGATVTNEDTWDDPLPLSIAPYNVWGAQFHSYLLMLHWDDVPDKRDRMQYILDRSDYIVITSNRFYASLTRNPQRWPMTIAYYRALFSGELGFDLVADFTSRPNLGPVEFHDDTAEEAWTVYDHPRVLIFKKTDTYDSARTAEILNGVDLDEAVRVIAKDSKGRPVRIPMPDSRYWIRSSQRTGHQGSSSLSYDPTRTDFYSRFQPLTVVIWWALITLFGWIAFPALYAAFPSLPDRAYPFSRLFGLLFVAWLAWMLSSLKILAWGFWPVMVAVVALAVLSAALIIPRRGEFFDWLKANRRHILLIEGALAVLFIMFVLIRLGNPDLWHPAKGGEKPMDMAYFNAVLKSSTFPPYDPWFAGGTINYYYYGYVIVGVPLKLLNIPMTLAYNLILPTLFALTGAGAFSVAYNLVAPHTLGDPLSPDRAPPPYPTLWETLRAWPQVTFEDVLVALRRHMEWIAGPDVRWKPYVAGFAALLLCVILGNLDEIRTVLWGLAQLGAGEPRWITTLFPDMNDFLRGLAIALGQDQLIPIPIDWWYWNATRVIPVPISDSGMPLEIGPITEFPFFTFLYADLHAHMIAMPITLFVISWCTAQIRRAARTDQDADTHRHTGLAFLNGFIGALTIGALIPTNTWDTPAYLLLGIAALALAGAYRRRDVVATQALGIGAIGAVILGGGTYMFIITSNITPSASAFYLLAAGFAALVGLLTGFALGLAIFRPRRSQEEDSSDILEHWLTLLSVVPSISALTVGAVVLYLPYLLNYELSYSGFLLWTGSKTPVWAYLDIQGLFLFLTLSWMTCESWRWLQAARAQGKRLKRLYIIPLLVVLIGYIGAIAVVAQSYPVVLIAVPVISWALLLFIKTDLGIEKRIVLIMLAMALALTIAVEIVVLQGDIARMNTVFKFYMQVWILMAVVAGAAAAWLWPALRRAPGLIRVPWTGILLILVFLAALYPLLATRAKVTDRWSSDAPHTLDGMAYMPYVQQYENGSLFSLRPDYEALRWLQDNIEGTPVILETHTIEYFWGSRVTVYTGLPAIVGWNWHQRQQRAADSNQVWDRVMDVQEAYNTTSIMHVLDILDRYNVELIIVGDLERAYYNSQGLEKFNVMVEQGYLDIIYNRDNTVIYQVLR